MSALALDQQVSAARPEAPVAADVRSPVPIERSVP